MNCSETKENLGAYLDGELTAAQAELLAHHLQSCTACRQELALLRNLAVGVAGLGTEKVPADFLERVRAKISDPAKPVAPVETLWQIWWREVWMPTWNWPKLPALAGALALLLLTGMIIMTQLKPDRNDAVELSYGKFSPKPAEIAALRLSREDAATKKSEGMNHNEFASVQSSQALALQESADPSNEEKKIAPLLAPAAPSASFQQQGPAEGRLNDRLDNSVQEELKLDRERSVSLPELRQFTVITEDVSGANESTKRVLAGLGGFWVKSATDRSGTELDTMTVQIPTGKVAAFFNELRKQGELGEITTALSASSPATVARESGGRSEKAAKAVVPAPSVKTGQDPDPRHVNSGQILSNAEPSPAAAAVAKSKDLDQKQIVSLDEAKVGSNKPALAGSTSEFTTLQIHFQQSAVARKQQFQQPQKLLPSNPENPVAGQKKG